MYWSRQVEDRTIENHSPHEHAHDSVSQKSCLAQRLIEAEARLARHQLALSEAQADLALVRHRAQEDISRTHKYAIEAFARALLAVKDNLETSLCIETSDRPAFKEGIALIHKQLASAFEAYGIGEINPQIGQPFDPARHRLASPVAAHQGDGSVAEVCEKGYEIGGRLLRPAVVSVSAPTSSR